MTGPVFLLSELSTDLKNTDSKTFHKRYIYMRIVKLFLRFTIFFILYFSYFYFYFYFDYFYIFVLKRSNIKRIGCAKARLLYIDHVEITSDRNSRSLMFFKTGDLKNSAIFTRKHLCLSLFLIKLF